MQIQLDGAAIKELVAALEAAEGDDARAAVDKRIVKRGADCKAGHGPANTARSRSQKIGQRMV